MVSTAMTDTKSQNAAKLPLRPSAKALVSERISQPPANGPTNLPVWVRAPKFGTEHYSGLTRGKLYDLAGRGKIRSESLREPGRKQGVRLFHLGSILAYVEGLSAEAREISPAPK
jgi:hypothetical protein